MTGPGGGPGALAPSAPDAPAHEAPGAGPLVEREELEARYRAYRRRQAARLLQLVPRAAIRPLLREAHGSRAGAEEVASGEDPLELLTRFCEGLLPLPPLETWLRDLERHPEAHLGDLRESVHAPDADAPATLDTREVSSAGVRWEVRLRAFRDADAWRGFMVFHDRSEGGAHRTATVFREADPLTLRERFRSFDRGALEAFLRSARP